VTPPRSFPKLLEALKDAPHSDDEGAIPFFESLKPKVGFLWGHSPFIQRLGVSTWISCPLTTWRTSSTVCMATYWIFRDLTHVLGVSYLYVDHKSGEEVCILTIRLSRLTYFVGGHRETASRLLLLIWPFPRAGVQYLAIFAGELLFRTWNCPLQACPNFVMTTMTG
jgi:hypothetical protein